jgi:presenilin-like A22 family membrane protease
MKHTVPVTALLLTVFVLAQITGLFLINKSVEEVKMVNDTIVVEYSSTAVGERPQTSGAGSFVYILFGIGIGTMILLLIVKYGKVNIWKLWFFLAVWLSMSIAFGVVMKFYIAYLLAFVIAVFKVYKPNVILHNASEIFIYAGIAVLLVPILNVLWTVILLLAISVYDIIAVWKSKHMVKIAKFTVNTNVFAGLFIPYKSKDNIPKPPGKPKGPSNAILGGGDIAFPLLFAGVVMQSLITKGFDKMIAFYLSLIITGTTLLALTLLFIFSEKKKFYPAMPFVTAGCLLGYGIILLI